MKSRHVLIAGGSALLLAGVAATSLTRGGMTPEETRLTAALQEREAEARKLTDTLASREADMDRLEVAVAEGRTEVERLKTTLAVRDKVIASLEANVSERDRTLDELRDKLARSEEHVRGLETELAALRDEQRFDRAVTAFKSDPWASEAKIETVAAVARPEEIDAVFRPAAAPAVPAPPASDRPMIEVQFDFASASLTPGGQAHAAAAAVNLAEMALERVRIIGHTDRVGSPAANRRLAEKRARAVAEFLVAAGLPPDLIETAGMDEAEGPVSTDDGVPEPLNRSVAIIPVPVPTS